MYKNLKNRLFLKLIDYEPISLVFEIWRQISKKNKSKIWFLMGIILLSGFSEFFTIASVLPFLEVLTDPDKIWGISYLKPFFLILGANSADELLTPVTFVFVMAVIFSSCIRLLNIWLTDYFSAIIGSELSTKVYSNALKQPYSYHLNTNTSIIINAISSQVQLLINVLKSYLQLISCLILSSFLISALIFIDWIAASIATILFTLAYVVLAFATKKRLLRNSVLVSNSNQKRIQVLQEGLGAIRDLILDNSQSEFIKIYQKVDLRSKYRDAQSGFISRFPRYAFEGLGLILIAFLSLVLVKNKLRGIDILPLLGGFALGAQKLLPTMQQVYGAWATIKSSSEGVKTVLDILNKNSEGYFFIDKNKIFDFKNSLELRNVSFKYQSSSELILKNINLKIYKGERIGIVGETGCGKSTLLDILLGLSKPLKGDFIVDGINIFKNTDDATIQYWRNIVSHVPQNIFLADTSFAENIAFGTPKNEIDLLRVKDAAKKAQISDYIENTDLGYQTFVGERGIKLSGGQRQRISIARALYKNSKIIVFDEATSALDTKTENSVISAIESLSKNLTIIMVAHRLSTLRKCDRLLYVDRGEIIKEESKNQSQG